MNRIKEILNELIDLGFVADDSQKAAERAIEDAIVGRNKDFRRNGMISFKSFIHGNDTMDKYAETYNRVYDAVLQSKALKEGMKNGTDVLDPSNNNKLNNMAKNDFSVDSQIKSLNELMTSLKGTKDTLCVIGAKYKRTYETLSNTMLQNTVKAFQANYQRTIKSIGDLVKQIEEIDIPFIKKEIDWWESR